MFKIQSKIGTAKDNNNSPIHNWYKFTAGFSYKFIDEIIRLEHLDSQTRVFDPFAGCGTTLVSCQKNKIPAIGYEGQKFMRDIIRAKLNWKLNIDLINKHLYTIKKSINEKNKQYNIKKRAHELLLSLYKEDDLIKLYIINDYLESIQKKDLHNSLFLKLALSQTLHKVNIHPIAIPYISRSRTINRTVSAIEVFNTIVYKMIEDVLELRDLEKTSRVYLHDARKPNRNIDENSCDICITSPPYLNNLDYGEVSKVHTHFFGITDTWNDITKKVRKNLVTASTTHYSESEFSLEEWKKRNLYIASKNIGNELIRYSTSIKRIREENKREKSFDLLVLYYFSDMFLVLQEIRRVIKNNKKAYLILGDSAPYGIYIPTSKLLGRISIIAGFNNYKTVEIRKRGTKWKSLRNRHSIHLSENVLIIK